MHPSNQSTQPSKSFFGFLSQWISAEEGVLISLQNHLVVFLLIGFANFGFTSAVIPLLVVLSEVEQNQTVLSLWKYVHLIKNKKSFDQVWGFYYQNRNQTLYQILFSRKKSAESKELSLFIFSLLVLGNTDQLLNPDQKTSEIVVFFTQDPSPQVSRNAYAVLKTINTQPSFNILCQAWIQNRDKQLELLIRNSHIQPSKDIKLITYVTLLRENFDPKLFNSADHIKELINIVKEDKKKIGVNAGYVLSNLQQQDLINLFCANWYQSREVKLEEILVHSQYCASSPDYLFLITRLKNNKNLNLIKITDERINLLITFLFDPDEKIRLNAEILLSNIKNSEGQVYFLNYFIENKTKKLIPILKKIEFNTNRLDLLAMAYFFAELWEKYEAIDFNSQILSTFFQSAENQQRENILKIIQNSGKIQFATILVSSSGQANIKSLSYAEAKSTIGLLTQYEKWDQLWQLSQITFPDLSFEIFKFLAQKNWKPSGENEKHFFLELIQIVNDIEKINLSQIITQIPFAVPISVLKFKGRINDIDFSPTNKIIAMATNQRAVLLWNYNKGKAEQLIRGFNHSIGKLSYGDKGKLYIGEKTNGTDYCDIWLWDDQKLSLIGFHQGSLTSITPITPDMVVTTGKDNRLIAWNTNTKSIINEEKLGWWPRAVLYNKHNNSIGLLNTYLSEHSIPDFNPLPFQFVQSNNKTISKSVFREALFTDFTREVLIGQNNGQIVLNQFNPDKQFHQQVLVHQLRGNLIGLSSSAIQDNYLALSNVGEVHLFDLNNQVQIVNQYITDHFTSFQISKDFSLFATGTKNAETILWDFRPIQCKNILNKSINDISNPQWAILKFVEKNAGLETNSRTFLHYINRMLENRFQYDIELSGVDQLSPGEFDIEIV